MCLIVFAWRAAPERRLLLAANRDEQHSRPSQDAHWWPDNPSILAGRDLQAGGTWLGVSKSGRFATVTNYREQQAPRRNALSRGALVTDFLDAEDDPLSFANAVAGDRYAGFNLLTTDGDQLVYFSNRGDDPVVLEPGVYGLANASLDTPWPKLTRSRERLAALIRVLPGRRDCTACRAAPCTTAWRHHGLIDVSAELRPRRAGAQQIANCLAATGLCLY